MKKLLASVLTIIICVLVAGLFGIIHDQITFSISTEYFTKFKYEQFGFDPKWFGGHRQTVVVIGFLATWWTGLIIGILLTLIGAFIFKSHLTMVSALKKAIIMTFCITIVFGILGFLYAHFILTRSGVDWYLPNNLIDKKSFITVGSIHNFSYLGGLFGLISGIVILVKRAKAENLDIA